MDISKWGAVQINHQETYAKGNIHTNTIEGFWSFVKRGIDGVYNSVRPKYLSYVNEYALRITIEKTKNLSS
jgi:transposase